MPPVSNTIPTEEAANGIAPGTSATSGLCSPAHHRRDSLGDKSTGKPNAYPPRSVLGGTQGVDYDRAAVRPHV